MISEQEQLEKKRPEASPFEKQKQQKKLIDDRLFDEDDIDSDDDFVKEIDDDECDDSFFYEGDSDSDTSDDFTEIGKFHEGGHPEAPKNEAEEKDGKRRCLQVCVCNDYQHVAKFKGFPYFEIFKVRIKLNDKNPIVRGQLYGEIVKIDSKYDLDNPLPISYYRVSSKKPDIINLDSDNQFALLPLSDPNPRPPCCNDYSLCLDFAFKLNGKDIFTCGDDVENRELFDDGCGNYSSKSDSIYLRPSIRRASRNGNCLSRRLIGEPTTDRILMGVYTGLFYGSCATVSVKMLKDGVSRFYGIIVARPCVFNTRFRLLTVQRDNNKPEIEQHGKGEVDEESRLIKLTRSVVSVPSYSSLIIGAALYDEDGTSLICRGKTAFAAKPYGPEVKCISSNGVKSLLVKVQWNRRAWCSCIL